MTYVKNTESNQTFISLEHADQVGAERQHTRRLWSSLSQACDLLRIELPPARLNNEFRLQHVQIKTGQRVFTLGQRFDSLYIVNSGFLKTVLIDDAGNEQVLGFPMKGDLLGVDGILAQRYESEAVALSDCDVICIPFKKMLALDRKNTGLEELMYDVISRELVGRHRMVRMLAALSAEARVAGFLVSLAGRYAMMGYSSKEFMLRMTRQEIGSFLGMTLETVTRAFSTFKETGLIGVNHRFITINNKAALDSLCGWSPRFRVNAKAELNIATNAALNTI